MPPKQLSAAAARKQRIAKFSENSKEMAKTNKTPLETKVAASAAGGPQTPSSNEEENAPSAVIKKRRKTNPNDTDDDEMMFDAEAVVDDDKSSKKRRQPGQKRGAGRKLKSGAENQNPGNPANVRTFMKVENNEQKLGAYLGYYNVSHIRKLALSWPMLKAYVAFQPIASNMPKFSPFILIRDEEESFVNVDRDTLWPLNIEGDSVQEISNKKKRHVACILLELEADLTAMSLYDEKTNTKIQRTWGSKFQKFAKCKTLVVDFHEGSENKVLFPRLSGYTGEDRLESLNRCWSLLKYLQFCTHANNIWEKRFTGPAVRQNVSIDISHVPGWMLPPVEKSSDLAKIIKSAEVIEADALPPLEITIVWDIDAEFEESDELREALAKAKQKNIPQPSTSQVLSQDPRLLSSIGAFRDSIRRQFDCQRLLVNIRSIDLIYSSAAHASKSMRKDIMRDDWSSTKSTFGNTENSNFVIDVTMQALDDPEEDAIYESFEPIPAISGFFTTASGDVAANEEGIAAIAEVAFEHAGKVVSEGKKRGESDGSNATFLDLLFSQGGNASEIGSPPDPLKQFPRPQDRQAMLAYYDGFDVTSEEGKREWQRSVLAEITQNGTVAKVTNDNVAKEFAKGLSEIEKESIQRAQDFGQIYAMGKDEEDIHNANEENYYTLQTAMSGTPDRAGPCADVCMALLDCIVDPNDERHERYIPRLLEAWTSRSFYLYQITGAVGIIIKMYGRIDGGKLLRGTGKENAACATRVREAAEKLRGLLIHGGILADELGLGKTVQALLVACIHVLLNDHTDKNENPIYLPMALILPPALVSQWIVEIRSQWKGLSPLVSYSDHDYKTAMEMSTLSHTLMTEYPSLQALPHNLKWVFDRSNPKAATAIIITSYDTNMNRAGVKKTKVIPGVPFKPPRRHPDGRMNWKKKPKKTHYWTTNQSGMYSLLIADEAQKIKNMATGMWTVIYLQSFRKTLMLTATPVYNSLRDILAPLLLLWTMVEVELKAHCITDAHASDWLTNVNIKDLDMITEVSKLEANDPLRLAALRPELLRRTVGATKDLHLKVSSVFKVVLDMVMIQRSFSSELPMEVGEPIKLKTLFKKISRKTATICRNQEEEVEYQHWHRKGAKEYINEISKDEGGGGLKSKLAKPRITKVSSGFVVAIKALRNLGIANFSTKLARLNAIMEHAKSNTHVARLADWRERGLEAQFVYEITRGKGEPEVTTARGLIKYLCDGSPVCRLTFQEILSANAIEELDVARYKHQKLLCAENLPVNAWFLQVVLRCALIDARVMTSALGNKAKSELVDEFNDADSTFKVLILMYDVGAAGLNLHHACNRALIGSIARALALEKQLGGRILRVTSLFNAIVTRRYTENSHDAFRSARQMDKATVSLATNAQDPALRALMVKLLNDLQPQITACHESEAGQKLLAEHLEQQSTHDVTLQERKRTAKQSYRETVSTQEAKGEASQLDVGLDFASRSSKRVRKQVERFSHQDYDDNGMLLTLKERKEQRIIARETQPCEICYKAVPPSTGDVCQECFLIAHYKCHGRPDFQATDEEFFCASCRFEDEAEENEEDDEDQHTESTFPKGDNHEHEEDQNTESTLLKVEDDEGANGSNTNFSDDEFRDHSEDQEEEENEDQSNDSDDEYGGDAQLTAKDRLREDLIEAREEAVFLRSIALDDFVSEDQPDDFQRHREALITLPKDKVWTDEDLQNERYLRLGLHLLYNKIQGKKDVHLSKSIHIRYSSFPKDVCRRMEKDRDVSKEQIQKAKAHAA